MVLFTAERALCEIVKNQLAMLFGFLAPAAAASK